MGGSLLVGIICVMTCVLLWNFSIEWNLNQQGSGRIAAANGADRELIVPKIVYSEEDIEYDPQGDFV